MPSSLLRLVSRADGWFKQSDRHRQLTEGSVWKIREMNGLSLYEIKTTVGLRIVELGFHELDNFVSRKKAQVPKNLFACNDANYNNWKELCMLEFINSVSVNSVMYLCDSILL